MSKSAPRRDYLDTANIDDIGRILTALVQESWVMRDRLAIVEQLLEERVGITAADIDDYVPTPAARQRIETLRTRFVGKVIGAPIAAQDLSVEQILSRAGLARGGAAS